MPLLAAWLGSLFTSIVGFFGAVLTKKVAIAVVIVSTFVALTTGFITGMNALLGTITAAAPAEITIAASWVVPSNAIACASAVVAAKLARWVYDMQVKALSLKAAV